MKRVCIDTHALVWYLSRSKRLGRTARRLLRDAGAGKAEVLIPMIVLIELSLLHDAGRKIVSIPQVEACLAAEPAFSLLPLDFTQALEFRMLDSLDDPFDRMVVAAARATKVPLLTADGTIEASGLVETIWD